MIINLLRLQVDLAKYRRIFSLTILGVGFSESGGSLLEIEIAHWSNHSWHFYGDILFWRLWSEWL